MLHDLELMGSMKFSTRRWSANLVFLLISSCFHLEFADAFTDTILQGQSISTSQTIISAAGNFELGFFKPGNSTNYYVGIWYKKVPERTVVSAQMVTFRFRTAIFSIK